MDCDLFTEHDEPRRRSELRLLAGVLRGDPEAERAFVERFVPVVEGCVRRFGRSKRVSAQDLEDMIGEVWLSLWENDKHRLRRFNPAREVCVSTWIGVLARNCSIDYVRQLRTPGAMVDEETVDGAPLPPDAIEQRERAAMARRALARLSEEELEFVRSLCIDEQETEAIAEELGIALATVYTRRFKIATKLAREVRRMEQPPLDPHVAAA